MTILVTGATGPVGRHLIDALLAQEQHVRALTRKPDGAGLPAPVDVVAGNLDEASTLSSELFDGVGKVFVFPAAGGLDALVEAALAAGVSRFVVLSSLAAAAEHPRDIGSASYVQHLAVENRSATEWTTTRFCDPAPSPTTCSAGRSW